MAKPRLENWSLRSSSNRYIPPEMVNFILVGEVYNHPVKRHHDGKFIQTSTLQKLELKKGIAKTQNTKYALGKPNEEWVAWLRENGYDKIEAFLKKEKI